MRLNLMAIAIVSVFTFSLNSMGKESVGNTEWKVRMQSMLTDVLTLFPFAFNPKKFSDPKNSSAIKKSMQSLEKHSVGLKNHIQKIDRAAGFKLDPSFPFIAESFENEIASARASFKSDTQLKSQYYLRLAVSKCIMCHTQSANGPEIVLSQFKGLFADLAPGDRFLALVATRQFGEALKEYENSLKAPPKEPQDEFVFDQQAKTALAMTVRVKKDSQQTRNLIEAISESRAGSPMLRADLKGWSASVTEWQQDKTPRPKTDQEFFNEAKSLFDKSQKKVMNLEREHNSDIPLLRASADLHDLLADFPQSSLRAESYLLLASIYDFLPGFGLWDLPDKYLGACIEENPHSEMGEKCYAEYEDKIIVGYSGSSGIHVPDAIRQHLLRMKKLSQKAQAPKPKK